jgi:predicted  nucleic acid-binding Zn-ribbon protein
MSEEMDNKFKTSVESITSIWNSLFQQLKQSQTEVSDMKEKFADTQATLDNKDAAYKELEGKYNEAKSKIDHIESQLSDTVGRLESLSKAKVKDVDAMQLLDIYLVLMEQVFESGPHVRLLLMLHGDAEEFKLNDLARVTMTIRKLLH